MPIYWCDFNIYRQEKQGNPFMAKIGIRIAYIPEKERQRFVENNER